MIFNQKMFDDLKLPSHRELAIKAIEVLNDVKMNYIQLIAKRKDIVDSYFLGMGWEYNTRTDFNGDFTFRENVKHTISLFLNKKELVIFGLTDHIKIDGYFYMLTLIGINKFFQCRIIDIIDLGNYLDITFETETF